MFRKCISSVYSWFILGLNTSKGGFIATFAKGGFKTRIKPSYSCFKQCLFLFYSCFILCLNTDTANQCISSIYSWFKTRISSVYSVFILVLNTSYSVFKTLLKINQLPLLPHKEQSNEIF